MSDVLSLRIVTGRSGSGARLLKKPADGAIRFHRTATTELVAGYRVHHMGISSEHTPASPVILTTEGEAAAGMSGGSGATRSETQMRSNDQSFPTLPEAPMSSSLRKARVRAGLFRTKVAPVRVGRFILVERLGAGNMGEIYAALDEQLDRRVALKLVRNGSGLEDDELLLSEAQALAKLSHPNVVHVYETGTHDGRLFIAMELVHGQTLTRWLQDAARMPRRQRHREILRRFIAAGRGLEAVHAAGVTHRDFKPDNVLVGNDGRVRVVDFGLAGAVVQERALGAAPDPTGGGPLAVAGDFERGETVPIDAARSPVLPGTRAAPVAADATAVDDKSGPPRVGSSGSPSGISLERTETADPNRAVSEALTLTAAVQPVKPGTVMGTPRFMAPEQMRGRVADHRSDQFSFCVALYHALTGQFPFVGEHLPELLDSIETGAISLEHIAGMRARVRKALRRGLSPDPSRRFANMGELLAAIEPSIRRRGGWIAGAVLLFMFPVAAYFSLRQPVDPCANVGGGIASSWSAEQQAAVHTAFSRSDLPYAEVGWLGAKQRIDGYAARWRDEATSACRVTYVDHAQSEQQFDRRMLCLERDRHQVAALVSELASGAPDAIQRAVETAEALPDVHACSHTESMMFGLEPPPAVVTAQVAAVRDQLARALILERLGRTEESLVIARGVREAAERLKYPPLRAEALVQIAGALDGRGTQAARTEAEALYFDALDIAEAVRHDQLAASIWSRLLLLATRMDPGMQQAHAWWRRYEAAVHRIGDGPYEQAKLHHMLGEIYYRESKYAEAADEENHAITAISGAPQQQLELSRYYDALARALEPQDRLDEAIRLHERALQIASDAVGTSHPDVIKYQLNYGNALERRGQYTRARSVLEAVLASMPASYRDSHIDAGKLHTFLSDLSYMEGKLDDAAAHGRETLRIYQNAGAPEHLRAEAYTDLGNVEMQRKNFVEALAHYQAALALRLPVLDHDHFQIGVNEGSIADALVGLSRYDEAMDHVREAERIFDRGSARDRTIQAWIHTVHGEALVGQHQLDAAVPVLEQALPLFEGVPDPSNQPRALWALARALHGLGKDAGRVRQLAEKARALFANLGSPEAGNREAVEQFIKRL